MKYVHACFLVTLIYKLIGRGIIGTDSISSVLIWLME